MSEENMKKVVGETFEDLSIAEMTMVQGAGEVEAQALTSPACLYSVMVTLKTSSAPCAGASAGVAISIFKC